MSTNNSDEMDDFENIDLDATTRSEIDNDKDKSSLNSSIENLDAETSSELDESSSTSEHLNHILNQFTNDYKKYFQLNPTRQVIV